MKKVSVIIPVYNVERFVDRCVESLMGQTLKDGIEYIFVDDASTDSSMKIVHEVVSRYPEHANQVMYLTHAENKGLPAARNTGLTAAQGEFVFHCDSDDFIEPEMLEEMLAAAERESADMVYCDFMLSFDQNERYMSQRSYTLGREALTGMLAGVIKYNVWNKLIRRSLYNGIKFPEGKSMGEDMTIIKVVSRANRVCHLPKAYYHYIRMNGEAMTQRYSEKKLSDLRENTADTIKYLETHVQDDRISQEINWFKLNVKLPFLFTGDKADIRRWREWYPEANKEILSNKNLVARTRALQWCAANHLGMINRIYNYLLLKIVYGKIYK